MSPWQSNLVEITIFFSLFPALLFLVFYNDFPRLLKYIGYFSVIKSICELIGRWMAETKTPNIVVLHVYTFLEFILLLCFFRWLFKELHQRTFSKYWIAGGAVLLLLNSLFIESIFMTPNSYYAKTLVNLILLGCCFISFFLLITHDHQLINRATLQLVISALFLNYAGITLIYLFSEQIDLLNKENQILVWIINAAINLIGQIIMVIAFLQMIFFPQQTKNYE